MAAQENGFWKANGLEAELVKFKGGAKLYQGIVAGAVNVGMTMAASELQARAGDVPTVIISRLHDDKAFFFWVRTKGRIKKPQDLKGAKVGGMRLAGSAHAYGRMVVKALGLEKDSKFIFAGGIRSSIALLRAGKTDAAVHPFHQLIKLKLKGEVKPLLRVGDFRLKEWMAYVITARRSFTIKESGLTGRIIKSFIQATNLINTNEGWTKKKLNELFGHSDEAARQV